MILGSDRDLSRGAGATGSGPTASMQIPSYGALMQTDLEIKESKPLRIDSSVTAKDIIIDNITNSATTLNALFGVGMFSMPWGFTQSGLLGGVVIFTIVAYLSYETARILLACQKKLFLVTDKVYGYPELAADALGPSWHYIVQTATVISCLGGCTGYMIFFGQTLGQVFTVSAETVLLYATIPLILLSWIRTFHELAIFTVVGVISQIVCVVILLRDGMLEYQAMVSEYGGGPSSDSSMNVIPLFLPDTILNYVGPATFLFTIHYCVLSIGAEALRLKPYLVLHDSETATDSSAAAAALDPTMDRGVLMRLSFSIALAYVAGFFIILVVAASGFILFRNADYVR